MKETDHFLILNKTTMQLDCSDGLQYGKFLIPDEARKLIDEHPDWPFPYHLKCEHDTKGLWWAYDPKAKEDFLNAMFEKKVEWSNPNIQCKHCGRIFDPGYEFIEDETLLEFCNGGTYEDPEDRFPNYCPECIEELYDFCNDAVAAFAEKDKIKD